MSAVPERGSRIPGSFAPGLLIAMPQLLDPNFYRAVVLVVEHGNEGSFGLVINQVSPLTMGEFTDAQSLVYSGDPTKPVMIGGPVSREVGWILHGNDLEYGDTHKITDVISMSRSMVALKDVCAKAGPSFRLFMGYAGWGPGQLESEITQGAWVTADVDPRLIFADDASAVWETSLRNMGINPMALVPGGSAIN
jgi:putative transcriptional regulator